MNTSKVLLGVLVSVAAGAALGILFAPEKGSDTRKKITQKKDDYTGKLEKKFNKLLDSITSKFEAVKKETAHLLENGKAKVEEVKAEAKAASTK